MSYFNHAYQKAFVGTKATQSFSANVRKAVDDGFLITSGVHTGFLSETAAPYALGVGTYGFFDPATYLSVIAADAIVTTGKPLVLAGSALMLNDKIGPFAGGYKESNKSKMINPRFINAFYKAEAYAPEQNIVHIGITNFNAGAASVTILSAGTGFTPGAAAGVATVTTGSGSGLTVDIVVSGGGVVTSVVIATPGVGYANGDVVTISDGTSTVDAEITIGTACTFDFLCGETYNLMINLNGSPVLRTLNHDAYRTFAAYTGCCPVDEIAPSNVDSTLVMINWAKQITESLYMKDFIQVIVYDQTGVSYFATEEQAIENGGTGTELWDDYVSPGYIDGTLAGIRLIGAFVETKFGDCTFQVSDGYEKDIVKIQASLVDETGNPCTFDGICINTECCGSPGQGFGETVLREVILHESYLQNHLSNDLRVREITQGNDIIASIDRSLLYTRYTIVHSIPRNSNATSIHDNDQYALTIYVPSTAGAASAFETFMSTWLTAANSYVSLETISHTSCNVVAPFVAA